MKVLWTDGSAKPNPGPGGFAVIEEGQAVCLGREEQTTNNRMEGLAIATAIKYAAGEPCEIHSDSNYWVKTLLEWAPQWKANGWRRSRGSGNKPIKNEDLVRSLYELYLDNEVTLEWTRGHVGTELNEMADEWANRARDNDVPDGYKEIKTPQGATVWLKGKGAK